MSWEFREVLNSGGSCFCGSRNSSRLLTSIPDLDTEFRLKKRSNHSAICWFEEHRLDKSRDELASYARCGPDRQRHNTMCSYEAATADKMALSADE